MRTHTKIYHLETIWDALAAYREDLIPEGDAGHDQTWDDICFSMAQITEQLGLEFDRGEWRLLTEEDA